MERLDHVAYSWTDTNAFPTTSTIVGIDSIAIGDVLDLRVRCTTADNVTLTVTDSNFNVFRIE